MADPAEALEGTAAKQAERGQVQREWILASADHGRRAKEALDRAAAVLADNVPGRPPGIELARAWAEVGQGWAAISHADAARSIAAAAFAVDQIGMSVYPST